MLTPEQTKWFIDLWGDDKCAHSGASKGCTSCLLRYAMRLAEKITELYKVPNGVSEGN